MFRVFNRRISSPLASCKGCMSSRGNDLLAMTSQFPDSEVLLVANPLAREQWAEELKSAGLKLRVYPDDVPESADLSKVEFSVSSAVWLPEEPVYSRCVNLKAVQSTGAGVDSMLSDPNIPRNIPLLRVIDPLMAERMATWVLWGIINIQRKCDGYYKAQRHHIWDKKLENHKSIDNQDLRVGIMGLGVMGGAVADCLVNLRYRVASWTRSKSKIRQDITQFFGRQELLDFANQSDVIVCLLPLTDETRGILNKDIFDAMPPGSAVINAARGGHLIVEDLTQALDNGPLESAILDVFDPEPLSSDSALWDHPKVRVFPHVSSNTHIGNAVDQMVRNRDIVLKGGTPSAEVLVDFNRGY